MWRIVVIVAILIVFAGLFTSCTPADSLGANLYTWSIYPDSTNTHDMGSYLYRWRNGYFNNLNIRTELTLGGVVYTSANISYGGNVTGVTATLPITSTGGAIPDIGISYDNTTLVVTGGNLGVIPGLYVTAEADPIFSASPAFGIAVANITGWNSLVSSQWVTDVSGIHYTGSVGVHTNSSATELVSLYSSDGISNDPVLSVIDNSASIDSTGIRVNMIGAKTDYTDGIYITNQCTTATAGSDKFGLRIRNTGNWLGAGSVNYGLYIEEPTGGTTNIAAFIDGDTTIGNDLDVVGYSSFTENITVNDQIILVGDGKVWIELRPDLDATKLSVNAKPTQIIRGIATGFSLPVGGADEELFYNICVPNRWDGESDIIVCIHFWVDTAQDHAADAAKFSLNWQQVGEGDEVPATYTTVTDEVVTGVCNQFTCFEMEFTINYDEVVADPIQDDDTLFLHLIRIASSQEIDGEPVIYHSGVHFQCDKIGNVDY